MDLDFLIPLYLFVGALYYIRLIEPLKFDVMSEWTKTQLSWLQAGTIVLWPAFIINRVVGFVVGFISRWRSTNDH